MVAVVLAVVMLALPQPSERAKLAITDRQPLAVRGSGFVPGERVHVTAAAGRNDDVRVVANWDGAFVARFSFAVPRCGRAWVRATGAKGTHARLSLRNVIACVPPTSAGSQ
ncbi:MAG: hypothetical protein H0U46_03180 [Actinobacteria bacterium]|nr:hypothetical protein [Actinomycetota bacterium]